MKNSWWIFCLCTFVFACHPNKNPKSGTHSDNSQFYPLSHFFQQQIDDVELGNFSMIKLNEMDGKRDSGSITKDEFLQMASPFLMKDVSAPRFMGRYSETVFHDLSTQSYTLNYKPVTSADTIQNIDILLDEKNNQVKRVFIRSEWQQKDTFVVEQCSWKAGQRFQINRYSKTAGGYRSNVLHQIVWKKLQP